MDETSMIIADVDLDSIVYLNGDFIRLADAKVSVLDRGFIFGDGIYDVVPAYGGKPFRMDGHLARLERCLAAIGIRNPYSRHTWEQLVLDMLARSGRGGDCIVYIQVTRGVAKRDHAFPKKEVPTTVFLMVSPFTRSQADREQGVKAVSIEDIRWLRCDIKSVSMLGNVLAKQAAVEAGVDEVLQFREDQLSEAAACNVWIVKDSVLLAPMRNNLILEGIRYGLIQELAAKAGIEFQARNITRAEVLSADEIMISSATKEILSVVELDGVPVGQGVPGQIFKKLRQGYDQAILSLEQV